MTLVEYALKFIGRPYVWGGDGSGKFGGGFDCSGLVLECLWAFGLYSGADTTAKTLYKSLLKQGWTNVSRGNETPGNVCFWGSNEASINHVSLVLQNGLHIEAGGGGSKCTSAENSTGMVRVRPITSRKNLFAILKMP